MIFGKVGLLYVARVTVRDDFAIGRRSRYDGSFYPWRGLFRGQCIENQYSEVVYDRTRPALSSGWKVGFTTNIRTRAISLVGECGSLEFVALVTCSRPAETNAHARLSAMGAALLPEGPRGRHQYGCSREWYRDSLEFRAWLDTMDASWRGSVSYQRHSGEPVPREICFIEARLVAREVVGVL